MAVFREKKHRRTSKLDITFKKVFSLKVVMMSARHSS